MHTQCWTEMLNRKNKTWKNVKGKTIENPSTAFWDKNRREAVEEGKGRRRRRSGEGQELNLSLRWKANGNLCGTNMRVIPGNWLVVGGSSGSFFLFFCANGKEVEKKRKWERERGREREREGGIYIALDWMLWCLLNWCRSSPEKGEGKSKRPKTKEGWSWEGQPQQKKRVRYGWKMHVIEERWDRAQEVNLEQISIVIEQESRMWRVVTGSG